MKNYIYENIHLHIVAQNWAYNLSHDFFSRFNITPIDEKSYEFEDWYYVKCLYQNKHVYMRQYYLSDLIRFMERNKLAHITDFDQLDALYKLSEE